MMVFAPGNSRSNSSGEIVPRVTCFFRDFFATAIVKSYPSRHHLANGFVGNRRLHKNCANFSDGLYQPSVTSLTLLLARSWAASGRAWRAPSWWWLVVKKVVLTA